MCCTKSCGPDLAIPTRRPGFFLTRPLICRVDRARSVAGEGLPVWVGVIIGDGRAEVSPCSLSLEKKSFGDTNDKGSILFVEIERIFPQPKVEKFSNLKLVVGAFIPIRGMEQIVPTVSARKTLFWTALFVPMRTVVNCRFLTRLRKKW